MRSARARDQQPGQWLMWASDNQRLGSGTRLKSTGATDLATSVKVALRMKDKFANEVDQGPQPRAQYGALEGAG